MEEDYNSTTYKEELSNEDTDVQTKERTLCYCQWHVTTLHYTTQSDTVTKYCYEDNIHVQTFSSIHFWVHVTNTDFHFRIILYIYDVDKHKKC